MKTLIVNALRMNSKTTGKSSSQTNNKGRMRLSTQLIILLLVLSIIPTAVLGFIVKGKIEGSIRDSVGVYSQKMIEQLATNMNYTLQDIKDDTNTLVYSDEAIRYIQEYYQLDAQQLDELEARFGAKVVETISNNKYLKGIFILYEDKIIYKKDATLGTESNLKALDKYLVSKAFLDSQEYKSILALSGNKQYWFKLSNEEANGIYVGERFKNSEGNNIVVIFTIDNSHYTNLLKISSIDVEIPILMIDKDKRIILSDNELLVDNKDFEAQFGKYIAYINGLGEESATSVYENKLITFSTLDNGWKVVLNGDIPVLMKNLYSVWNQLIIVLVLFIVLIVSISVFFSRKISGPISIMSNYIGQVEQGDLEWGYKLSKEVPVHNKEIKALRDGLVSMISTLKKIIGDAKEVTDIVEKNMQGLQTIAQSTSSSAADIEIAVDNIVMGAISQSKQIESSSLGINELSTYINSVNGIMNTIKKASDTTIYMSENAKDEMNVLISNTNDTNRITQVVNDDVEVLGKEVNNIENIVHIIKSVNEQTNLLALNAAIEAARAKESGKGFMVIAEEIRKLSYQTNKAIGSVEKMIINIHDKNILTLAHMKEAKILFEGQEPIVTATTDKFNSILSEMTGLNTAIQKATVLLNQVSHKKDSVMSDIQEIANVTQQSASITEEVSAQCSTQVGYSEEMIKMGGIVYSSIQELKNTYRRFQGK